MTTAAPVRLRIRYVAIALLALSIFAAGGPWAAAGTKQRLEEARGRLSTLEGQISEQRSRLQELQGELNALTGQLDEAQARVARTQMRIDTARRGMREAEHRYLALQRRLERRARMSYEQGVGGVIDVVLSSSSLSDLSDRVAFANRAAQSDADLATRVEHHAAELDFRRQDLEALAGRQHADLDDLRHQQSALADTFAEHQSVAADLSDKQKELSGLVADLKGQLEAEEIARAKAAAQPDPPAAPDPDPDPGPAPDPGPTGGSVAGSPFQVCPVGSPHSYVDSFGAPRVGHVHAGNDIMAPEGTPIYAPFSGRASSSSSGIGGLQVYVYGSGGYVFNAHLSRVGQLGGVSAGTVVGYVGATGNASGGSPHDHFEWHPSSIPSSPYRSPYGYTNISGAIDPFPYLNQVC